MPALARVRSMPNEIAFRLSRNITSMPRKPRCALLIFPRDSFRWVFTRVEGPDRGKARERREKERDYVCVCSFTPPVTMLLSSAESQPTVWKPQSQNAEITRAGGISASNRLPGKDRPPVRQPCCETGNITTIATDDHGGRASRGKKNPGRPTEGSRRDRIQSLKIVRQICPRLKKKKDDEENKKEGSIGRRRLHARWILHCGFPSWLDFREESFEYNPRLQISNRGRKIDGARHARP